MSDYTQTTDFSAKDSLTTGDPEKVILGSDVDVELSAIAAAIASKRDDGDIANADLADMAQARVKGRTATGGTGAPVDLTAAQLVDIIETADGAGSGIDADNVDGVGPFASGTYTPTLTVVTNMDSVTLTGVALYIRIGSNVFVSMQVSVNSNVDPGNSEFAVSLPVASALAAAGDLHGSFNKKFGGLDNSASGTVTADTTNDRALVSYGSDTTAAVIGTLQFMYRVL